MKRLRILSLDMILFPVRYLWKYLRKTLTRLATLASFLRLYTYPSISIFFVAPLMVPKSGNSVSLRLVRVLQPSEVNWRQMQKYNWNLHQQPRYQLSLLNLFSSNPHSPHPLPTPFNTSSTRCISIRHRTKSKPGVVTVYPTQERWTRGTALSTGRHRNWRIEDVECRRSLSLDPTCGMKTQIQCAGTTPCTKTTFNQ